MAPSGHRVRSPPRAALDIADAHIWLSTVDLGFLVNSGQLNLLLEGGVLEPDLSVLPDQAMKAPELYYADREELLGVLQEEIDLWADWAEERELPLITSEAWGPVNYDDVDSIPGTSEWDWVKDVCEEGVRMAVDRGWTGICTRNFAQPHFEGMWSDLAWHRAQTASIRSTAAPTERAL